MLGDVTDFIRRMRAVLPPRWFGDVSPLLDAVLAGFGAAWSAIYDLISEVRLAARIATASGVFLDMADLDFFGATLARRQNESDMAFRLRIKQEMLRPRGTRSALMTSVTQLTGYVPKVFEPARPADTGAYASGGLGYGVAGGWGNLSLHNVCFVVARRPSGAGIAEFAGYGTGGVVAYGDLALVASPVKDADIYAQIAAVVPVAQTAWVQITG